MMGRLPIFTPLGTALEVDLVPLPLSSGWSQDILLTIGWGKESDGVRKIREWVSWYAEMTLGAEAPALLASGEIWSPLRDGEVERPGDPRFAGKVFAELRAYGDIIYIVDKRPGGSGNCIWFPNPETDPIFGPGSELQVSAMVMINEGCPVLRLCGGIAVRRGAPGWEMGPTTSRAR